MKIGDEILKVNGTSVIGTDSSYAIGLIKSLSGTVNVIAKRSNQESAKVSPDSETIVASVFKSSTDTKVGITLYVDVEGKIVVHNLSGLFAATELRIGDEIVKVRLCGSGSTVTQVGAWLELAGVLAGRHLNGVRAMVVRPSPIKSIF